MQEWATNRTNLELKRTPLCDTAFLRCLPIVPIWNWNESKEVQPTRTLNYQSYQSGIETCTTQCPLIRLSCYQSYQSGIETLSKSGCFVNVPTTNRTNLELKPCQSLGVLSMFRLPIVPIWNWNVISVVQHPRHVKLPIVPIWNWNGDGQEPGDSPAATNRTNLELKQEWIGGMDCCHVLPIVPIWNWNVALVMFSVPHMSLPIVPIWNWNTVRTGGVLRMVLTTNRTNLELKLNDMYSLEIDLDYQSYQSGIETAIKSRRNTPVIRYQSYQSGIETVLNSTEILSGRTTNRTNLELKRMFYFNDKRSATSTNRTNLELKHLNFQLRISWVLSTNRTNLELKLDCQRGATTRQKLPIVPIWNWNEKCHVEVILQCQLPIVPIWNWNAYKYKSRGFANTTNRTNLELKLKYFEEGMVDDVTLPIVPIWNWNMRFFNLFKWLFATNRTNLELKLIHACLEGEKEACYQSYQSGIETCERVRPAVCMFLPIVPIWNWNQQLRLHRFRRWWSTNRTNLELKRQ